jgi:probable phosphoglycerate mutase
MPQKIIIVRHGETQYNVERRLQGWTDIPLNESGHDQAIKVATRLSSESISFIYSSDHERAHQTAIHIAKFHLLTPQKQPELRENYMGIFEGWQWEKEPDPAKEKLWKERDIARANGDINWNLAEDESIKDHTKRVQNLVDRIESKHKDGTIVIVTHGGTINRLMEIFHFKKVTDEYISYKNTSVTILTRNKSSYDLTVNNDISHLLNIG